MRIARISMVLVALLFAAPGARAGETVLAEPHPSIDAPRRVVVSMSTKDTEKVNHLLYNVVNLQKFYGQDNVEIAVVGWGPGVRPLLKQDSTVRARIESLIQYGVHFYACGNTLDTIGDRSVKDLIDGVEWVQAGLPEIIERRLRGWVDIWPP